MTAAGRRSGLFAGSRIRIAPDPALRVRATPVTVFDASLRTLVEDMYAVMYAAPGVGLAANQIGIDLAVFVMDCAGVRAVVVNPHLEIPTDTGWQQDVEGCLSLPGEHRPRRRASTARVYGVDAHGEPVDLVATGVAARCLQHECDHLAGRLFTDPVRDRRPPSTG